MNTSSSESIAYLGLGSNLDSPVDQINKARISIRGINRVTELVFSSLYVSAPMGPQNQPDYVNAVMAISTTLSPMALLNELQTIERSQGRIRGDQRWCARTLDLDLLLYGDQEIDLPELTVPHPGMVDRPFELYPLHDCAAGLNIPGKGNVSKLLEHCPIDGLRRLESD